MVTAIPVSKATVIKLYHTNVVLYNASVQLLKMLWAFKALILLHDECSINMIYVVEGISHLLLSHTMMKDLEPLHLDFPHYHSALGLAGHSQEEPPPELTTRRVRFGTPQDHSTLGCLKWWVEPAKDRSFLNRQSGQSQKPLKTPFAPALERTVDIIPARIGG
jgi:hypothetical protein